MRKDDYELTVCVVDLTPEDEVKANIQLNNPSIQGEWDVDMLGEIKLSFPEIDFVEDLGFEKPELDFMFDGQEDTTSPEIKETEASIDQIMKIKEMKKDYRKQTKALNENGEADWVVDKDDYYLTIAFPDNKSKWDFMRLIHKQKEAKYIMFSDMESIIIKKGKNAK